MITPDYNIISSETDTPDWSRARLLIECGHQYFHYIVVQDDGAILALKYYQLTSAPDKNYVELLEEILAADELLQKNIRTRGVVYNVPENHLVPRELYREDMSKAMLDLAHGDLYKGTIFCDKIENTAINNIYRVPSEVHRLLEQRFAPEQFVHFCTLWIGLKDREESIPANSLTIVFYQNEFQIMLIKENTLQLMQRYAYQVAEDVGYHLLNIYQQYELSVQEFPVRVSGMVTKDSDMYHELLKYFMQVDTVSLPQSLELPEAFAGFPPHFFSPILKIAVCAS